MILYKCDGCGKTIKPKALRYKVRIDVRAAYDELEIGLMDLVRDHREEMVRLIEQLSSKESKEVEESVYKRIDLDLCPSCQKVYIQDPIHFHPNHARPEKEFDIDEFLRSIGLGEEAQED